MADHYHRALGAALMWLRSVLGVSQTRLAKMAGLASNALLSDYERGDRLTRERADTLAGLMGFSREALDALVFAFHLVFPPEPAQTASPLDLTPKELAPINRACLAAGLTAAEAVRAELVHRKRKEKADAALLEAREAWERLKPLSPEDRRKLVSRFPKHRRWAVAVVACEASIRAAAHRADQALDIARLALFIAERVREAESFRHRLQGYCWAHVGNALRVGEDFGSADQAFVTAWELWRAGAEADSELLPEWQLLSLEASLRRVEQRFSEALKLLDQAEAAGESEPAAIGRILLQKERVFNLLGDIQAAWQALAKAAPIVEASGDPRQIFALRFNMIDELCDLERYAEAATLLPQVRDLAVERADELSLTYVLWLSARVAAGEGRTEEAIASLDQARADFTERELPYQAALVSLELALLWLKVARIGEVKKLALAMTWIFRAKGIDREALVALSLFCDAAKREYVTVELAQHVMTEIKKRRPSASAS